MAKITLDKVEAARRQIDAAIHSGTAAVLGLLKSLCEAAGQVEASNGLPIGSHPDLKLKTTKAAVLKSRMPGYEDALALLFPDVPADAAALEKDILYPGITRETMALIPSKLFVEVEPNHFCVVPHEAKHVTSIELIRLQRTRANLVRQWIETMTDKNAPAQEKTLCRGNLRFAHASWGPEMRCFIEKRRPEVVKARMKGSKR